MTGPYYVKTPLLPFLMATEHQTTPHKINMALRECLRVISGGLRSTPIPLLHSQTGLPTLESMIRDASRRLYLRIHEYPECFLHQEYYAWDSSVYNSSPLLGLLNVETSIPEYLNEHPVKGSQ